MTQRTPIQHDWLVSRNAHLEDEILALSKALSLAKRDQRVAKTRASAASKVAGKALEREYYLMQALLPFARFAEDPELRVSETETPDDHVVVRLGHLVLTAGDFRWAWDPRWRYGAEAGIEPPPRSRSL